MASCFFAVGGSGSGFVVEHQTSQGRRTGWNSVECPKVLEGALHGLVERITRGQPGHLEHKQGILGGGFLPGVDRRHAGVVASRFPKPTRALMIFATVVKTCLEQTMHQRPEAGAQPTGLGWFLVEGRIVKMLGADPGEGPPIGRSELRTVEQSRIKQRIIATVQRSRSKKALIELRKQQSVR